MKNKILEKIKIYENEAKNVAENRERLIGLVEQHEAKLQQISGAISALKNILKEEEEEDVRLKSRSNSESEIADRNVNAERQDQNSGREA